MPSWSAEQMVGDRTPWRARVKHRLYRMRGYKRLGKLEAVRRLTDDDIMRKRDGS
jgi:hypothetical protein